MSMYDRAGPLPEEEEERLIYLTWKILGALQQGPKTSAELAEIALDYSRRIFDLFNKYGYHIRSERIPDSGGLWRYTLLSEPDPLYEGTIQITTPDGRTLVYKNTVHADCEAKAKNRSARKGLKIKVLSVRRITPPGPQPAISPQPLSPAPQIEPFAALRP